MKTLSTLFSAVLMSLLITGIALAADTETPNAIAAAATVADAGATTWIAAILGVLLAVSELLALIPGVKSNGIFDAVYKGLKAISGKEGQ